MTSSFLINNVYFSCVSADAVNKLHSITENDRRPLFTHVFTKIGILGLTLVYIYQDW